MRGHPHSFLLLRMFNKDSFPMLVPKESTGITSIRENNEENNKVIKNLNIGIRKHCHQKHENPKQSYKLAPAWRSTSNIYSAV